MTVYRRNGPARRNSPVPDRTRMPGPHEHTLRECTVFRRLLVVVAIRRPEWQGRSASQLTVGEEEQAQSGDPLKVAIGRHQRQLLFDRRRRN